MTRAEFRAAVDAALTASCQPVTSAYDWLGVMTMQDVFWASYRVARVRASDAAFSAHQREFDALVAAQRAAEQPEMKDAA